MDDATDVSPPVLRSVGLSSTGVFLVSLAIQLLGYIPTHFFAAHVGISNAGRDVLGLLQWFLLLASSINMIGDLRVGSAFVYYVARGEAPRVGAGTYLLLRLGMVGTAGALLWFLAPGYDTRGHLELFALWMLLPVLWSISTVYSQYWVAQGHSVRGQVPLLVESVVRTALLTVIAVQSLALPAASYTDILGPVTYAYLVGAAVAAVVCLPTVVRAAERFRGPVARRYFRFAWPLMGSLILLYLSTTLIQFLVVVASPQGPDIYNVFLSANGLRILALSVPAAVAVPLFPHLSSLHQRRDYEVIRQRTWAALRYTAMVVVPLAMAMVVYRVNVLNILYSGPYATEGATALALLALSAVPASLSQIVGTALNSVGQQRLELYITALQVGVLVVVSLMILTPYKLFGFSILAAGSLAVLLSSLAALGLNTYFMERRLAVRIQVRPVLTIVGAAAVSFLAVSQFNRLFLNFPPTSHNIFQLIGGVVLGYAVYGLVLAFSGELSKADVRLIIGALGLPASLAKGLARVCWREETWPVNPLPRNGAEALRPLDESSGRAPDSPPKNPP